MRQTYDQTRIALCTALLLAAHLARSAQAQGTVIGRVTDQTLSPIRDAEVVISRMGAPTRSDSTGRFHFRGVPPGLQRIDVRRLGFAPASIEVLVPDHDSVVVQIRLVPSAQPLPAVPVEGAQPMDYRLKDFERRRSSGVGQFLTAADLAPERSKSLGDVVGRLRGTYVVRSTTAACLTATRGAQSVQNAATGWCGNQSIGGAYCPVAVFVDGYPSYTGHHEEVFNLNSLRADEVFGVEFYSGAGTIPARTQRIAGHVWCSCDLDQTVTSRGLTGFAAGSGLWNARRHSLRSCPPRDLIDPLQLKPIR